MYIIVMGICELVSLVVQQSGTSTLQQRTRPGLLDDVARTGPMRKRVAQRSCDDVIRAALLMLFVAENIIVTALSIMSKIF